MLHFRTFFSWGLGLLFKVYYKNSQNNIAFDFTSLQTWVSKQSLIVI